MARRLFKQGAHDGIPLYAVPDTPCDRIGKTDELIRLIAGTPDLVHADTQFAQSSGKSGTLRLA